MDGKKCRIEETRDSEKLGVDVQVRDGMNSPRLFVICSEAAENEQYRCVRDKEKERERKSRMQ